MMLIRQKQQAMMVLGVDFCLLNWQSAVAVVWPERMI